MGTLFNQPVRQSFEFEERHENYLLQEAKSLMEKGDISMQDAIKLLEIHELRRRNDLYKINGDIWDEQISGIGEILQKLCK